MPESSILQTAITAHNAGLCTLRAATDGTKRPDRAWKIRQSVRPDLSDVIAEHRDWPNVGLVTGAISDRLVCIDIEGRFAERIGDLAEAMEAADLGDTFASWLGSYCETTPSDGIHILVHVGGDGPVIGNVKLALDADRQTLIETRGEGGFVVIAPSNGTTHPSGGAWRLTHGGLGEIAWATPEEFDAVLDVLRSFDETPVQPAPPPSRPRLTVVGDSWIDAELARYEAIETVLERWGWRYMRDDGHGQLWKRPDKNTPGHSARVNDAGRLIVFSASTPFETQPRSYDALDVDIISSLGRTPGHEEMLAERTTWLRRRRPTISSPPPTAAPEPGDIPLGSGDLWLPPDFWSQRPVLQEIYDAALLAMLSPEGVLGAFLSCYATTVPMSIKLPKIVGAPSPLNTYCALVATSGGGKSTSMALALDLLGYPESLHPDVLLNRSLRSGEGTVTLATKPKTKDNPDPGFRQAIQIVFDEGGTMSAQSSRTGSTTISYLDAAWSGIAIVGGAKAAESGSFPSSLVRVCAVMGVQYGACANLFTGEAEHQGFPQRLLYFGLENPILAGIEITSADIADANPVNVQFWDHGEFAHNTRRLGVPDDIVVEVRRWTQQRNGGHLRESLDSHQMLIQLRTAALFALMDDRATLNEADWFLASTICTTSRCVRSKMVASIDEVHLDRARALGRQDVVRQEAADAHWLIGKAQRIAGKLTGVKEGFSRKDIRAFLSGDEKRRFNEILDHAVASGVLVHRDGRYYA